jgi:ABC-type lipoprotein release transport system permease subunit
MGGIERQRHFIDFTLSCLWRRRWKHLALLAVYTGLIFLIASALFFAGAVRREAQALLAEAPEMVVQRMVAGRHDLIPVAYAETIEGIRGARSVRPRLWGYYFNMAAGANFTLMVPEEFAHGDDAVAVGEGVLRTWGAARDNQLYFQTHDREAILLTVAETFGESAGLVSSDLILMSEPTFRRITGVPEGFATDLSVRIRNLRESETIAEKILRALPDTRPISREEIQRTYDAVFDWRGGYILVLLSGSLVAFFIFAWDRAGGLSGEERQEIGVLKAVGWDTADVLAVRFWEGAAVSLAAFLLGTGLAWLHVFAASAPLFEHALKGWAVLYPRFQLRPDVDPFALATLFFLTVLPYTLITVIPVWRAATLDPDTVMRRGG